MTATRVTYRAERSGAHRGEVTAVFPDMPERYGYLTCYAHIGQHSACAPGWYRGTRPATPEEYLPLHCELAGIYGPLKIVRRIPSHAWAAGR